MGYHTTWTGRYGEACLLLRETFRDISDSGWSIRECDLVQVFYLFYEELLRRLPDRANDGLVASSIWKIR